MGDYNEEELLEIREKVKEPIRVLHVFGRLGLGGAESRIMDLYRNIDRSKIQFDFLVHCDTPVEGNKCPSSDELMAVRKPDYFDEEVLRLGGRIYAVPRFEGFNKKTYETAIDRFFAEHQGFWRVVQGHMTSTAAIYLPIAKKYGVLVTASHVRSAGADPGLKGLATNFLRRPFKKEGVADFYLACTENAARHVYGDRLVDEDKVVIIPNAINVRKFLYNPSKREEIRRELGIENAIVIGHVGRFHYAKNHEFLVDVFAEMLCLIKEDKDNNYLIMYGLPLKLMLLGEGPLQNDIKKKVEQLGIGDKVMFLNNHSNVSDYYQAMDYFCFPSRYEGLPGTVVEAQASGLQCLISDTITPEVDITPLVERMSLQEGALVWAKKIMSDLTGSIPDKSVKEAGESSVTEEEKIADKLDLDFPKERYLDRAESGEYIAQIIQNAGFDAKTQADMMSFFYEKGQFPY